MKNDIIFPDKLWRRGSALILAVVITSLLAIMGTVFLMMARVDNIATSDISTSRELNFAAQSVVALISEQLVKDVPGVDAKAYFQKYGKKIDPGVDVNEFYDYPGDADRWLASNVPYLYDVNDYRWRQISDVTGYFEKVKTSTSPSIDIATQDVRIDAGSDIIRDYPGIELKSAANGFTYTDEGNNDDGDGTQYRGQPADADGDGVADSKWIELEDITSSKGEKIYAAIRVIDNGGMLNVNTASQLIAYGPNIKANTVDGHSQSHVNLTKIATGGDTVEEVISARDNMGAGGYESSFFWNYNGNYGNYTPFDISDELELRNRFCIVSKAENRFKNLWYDTVGDLSGVSNEDIPYDGRTNHGIGAWQAKMNILDVNDTSYDRRHMLTNYNIDRVIDPNGDKLVNVRKGEFDAQRLYNYMMFNGDCVGLGFDEIQLAQVVANIKDYGDRETWPKVTTVEDTLGNPHYGDEAPYLCLSELVCKSYNKRLKPTGSETHYSYAIEVYKPFVAPNQEKFNDWQLVIENPSADVRKIPLSDESFTKSGGRLFVIVFQDPNVDLASDAKFTDSPGNGAVGVDPAAVLDWGTIEIQDSDGEWHNANKYYVYFGTDEEAVTDANLDDPHGVLVPPTEYSGTSYDPSAITKSRPYQSRTYYWRVDAYYDMEDSNALNDISDIGDVWSYTTYENPDDPEDANGPRADVNEIGKDDIIFEVGGNIRLEREVNGAGYITVDQVLLDPNLVSWLKQPPPRGEYRTYSYQRDIHSKARLQRIWRTRSNNLANLGRTNGWSSGEGKFQILRHRFNNVGEVGNVFKKSTYVESPDRILRDDTEKAVRLDLTDPNVQNIFRYITVMDPNDHGNPPSEMRVKGRVNINTAPWYVIAQLPWVSVEVPDGEIAKAIVAYRDKINLNGTSEINKPNYTTRIGNFGFRAIGQLTSVIGGTDKKYNINFYGTDNNKDQQGFPDLTVNNRSQKDGVADDYEEKNLIFSRISDLVTVRSDVFTAYILVRMGINGPQQRVVAILDRSGVSKSSDPVKVIALYKVPDPR